MIVVSNGHHKFITGMAAAEAAKRGVLAGFLTAGYPTPGVREAASRLGLERFAAVRRLLQRREEVPDGLVHSLWLSELVYGAARVAGRLLPRFEDLSDYGLQCYAWQAERRIARLSAGIYHYRSGYGRGSVPLAKRKGMVALCDHSIAHPLALAHLVENGGRLPPPGRIPAVGRLWGNILKDVEQADFVLVNSDFVKDTFLHFGYDPARIFVLYTGVDDQLLSAVPARSFSPLAGQAPKLLFAGDLGERKGGRILLQALSRIRDLPWRFEAVGTVTPDLRRDFADFFADRRVTLTGFLPRAELAERLGGADVFVFPSLAEGSARVVFLAMACGCCVVTTPNAGSVVKDGEGGRLVPPGDADALAAALRETLLRPEAIPAAGRGNMALIKSRYTQGHYGAGLMALYDTLMEH